MSRKPTEPKPPRTLPDDEWRSWYRELRIAVEDMRAVTADRLARKRERDLGIREATRLYHDADDKLARLFVHVEGGGGDDESGREPARAT